MCVARILHGNESLYLSFYIVAYGRSGAREIVRFTYTLENFIFLEKDRALFYKDARSSSMYCSSSVNWIDFSLDKMVFVFPHSR